MNSVLDQIMSEAELDADEEFELLTDDYEQDLWQEEVDRSSREYIRWVQKSLNKVLGSGLRVDGVAGPNTRAVVRAFQKKFALAVDGVVGDQTEAMLTMLSFTAPPQASSSSSGSGTSPNPTTTITTSFVPIAVENPGGGRIQDKTEPSQADRVVVKGYRGKRVTLHRLAARALQAMMAAARRDGIDEPLLQAVSGYRSVAHQKKLWAEALARYGTAKKARKWVAIPGGSPHHSGRAIDLWVGYGISSQNVARMRQQPVYHWLQANAHLFGFYPYPAEPWHWEYNPKASSSTLEGEVAC